MYDTIADGLAACKALLAGQLSRCSGAAPGLPWPSLADVFPAPQLFNARRFVAPLNGRARLLQA